MCLSASAEPPADAATNLVDRTAVVRTVKGEARRVQNGASKRLKPNVEISPGTTVLTGSHSEAYLSVNGVTSAIAVDPSSDLNLMEMKKMGRGPTAESETVLNLKSGSIFGQVKKITANSKYEIRTPNGVASIRGTDFYIEVEPSASGTPHVKFFSIAGTVVVSAAVEGQVESVTLHSGQECETDVGHLMATQIDTATMAKLNERCVIICGGPGYPQPMPPPPPPPIVQPFNGNGPPRQTASSPH